MRAKRSDEHGESKAAGPMTEDEIVSLVCSEFCRGTPVSEIAETMKRRGEFMTREKPYQILQKAARMGRLQYMAPRESELRRAFQDQFPWLSDVEVVRTAALEDVVKAGAAMLQRMICRHPADDVHIGLAAGNTVQRLSAEFAKLLREPRPEMKRKRLVFHALASGFDPCQPTNNPETFFVYFLPDAGLQVKTDFVGLHAPGLISAKKRADLCEAPPVKEALARASEIDIIITSAMSWSQPHEGHISLVEGLQRAKVHDEQRSKDVAKLREAGCCGDLMWLPISAKGHLEDVKVEYQPMTLMRLSDLPGFIQRGKEVMLIIGPCTVCGIPKGDILRVILNQEKKLCSRLVVDSRSAREAIEAQVS